MNPETVALGVQTTVVGLGIVFCILAVLWLLTTWLDRIVESTTNKKPPSAGPGARPPAPPTPAPAAASTTPAGGLSAHSVAAILGAISAFSGKPLAALRFAAIRRAGDTRPGWGQAGIAEQIHIRQQYL
jgi:Na+-transporting methylmalonyl-CoA/oxaloacetate decarboxylase gamma subunit